MAYPGTIDQVRKALIPAAGLGTRFLPATKAVPKEMIPLIDKPGIQYVVEEAVRSGIDDVLVVTGRGKETLEDHFDRSTELERQLEASGKDSELAMVRAVASLPRIHFVRQGQPLGLGHAVGMGRQHVGQAPFAVLLPDDLMDEGVCLLKRMLDVHRSHAVTVLALTPVPAAEISLYGCAGVEEVEPGLVRVLELAEKPSPREAPSNLAVVGRYVLTPAIFDALDAVGPGRGGEIQLTDAIAALMRTEDVYGCVFTEGRYDTGNKLDFLRATVELALKHPELGPPFKRMLSELGGLDT